MAAQKAVYKNSEVKNRVIERLSAVVIESGKVSQSIVKNSKNKDIIHQATKHFVNLDSSIATMEHNLQNIEKTTKRMEKQHPDAQNMLDHIERMTRKLHEI